MITFTARITANGSLDLPEAVREELARHAGDAVRVSLDADQIEQPAEPGLVASTAGALARFAHRPAPSAAELRAMAEHAVAEEAMIRTLNSEDDAVR